MKKLFIILLVCLFLTGCSSQKSLSMDRMYFQENSEHNFGGPTLDFHGDKTAYFAYSLAHSYLHEMKYRIDGNDVILSREGKKIMEIKIISNDKIKVVKTYGDDYIKAGELEGQILKLDPLD